MVRMLVRRGKPRNAWRRDFIVEMEIEGYR
jgi:hypothetical protein